MDNNVTYKNIGIDIQPPMRSCNSDKCPWHGNVRIHGFVFEGTVKRIKHHIALIERKIYRKSRKYERYLIKISKIKAYLPECLDIKVGDKVLIGETRPLSKTISFVVLNKI